MKVSFTEIFGDYRTVAILYNDFGFVPFMASTDLVDTGSLAFTGFLVTGLLSVGVRRENVYRWFTPYWEN